MITHALMIHLIRSLDVATLLQQNERRDHCQSKAMNKTMYNNNNGGFMTL